MIYPRLHLDFETRSARELGKGPNAVGLHRYAACPTTSAWMFSYRFEYGPQQYGPVKRWWRDQALPDEVVDHVAIGFPVYGHNVTFERITWNAVLPRQLGIALPVMSIEQTDCTMARARAIGLPGDLERAAKVVAAPVQKDTAGAGTMIKMAKPRAVTFSSEAAGHAYYGGDWLEATSDGLSQTHLCVGFTGHMDVTWWYDTTLRDTLSRYCDDDVYAECGVDCVVPALSASERATWELDQKINDRGIMADKSFIERVIKIVDLAIAGANRRMWTLTGGKVKKCTGHAAVRQWLNGRGIACDSVAKGETEALVVLSATKGDKDAREVIELHNASAKASTSKFKRALVQMGDDWRLRGQFSYHVANATGRWAGSGVQLQNLVRVDEDRDLPTIRVIVDIVENFETTTAFDLIGAL